MRYEDENIWLTQKIRKIDVVQQNSRNKKLGVIDARYRVNKQLIITTKQNKKKDAA